MRSQMGIDGDSMIPADHSVHAGIIQQAAIVLKKEEAVSRNMAREMLNRLFKSPRVNPAKPF